MAVHPPKAPEVFVSYSSTDKDFKEELLKQLEVLAAQGVISAWHDGLLVPGEQWNDKIVAHLNSSRVILLLISPDFLTSDYVNKVELKTAADRHKRGQACIIPVLVRNVNAWNGFPFGDMKLGDLQALPADERFISGLRNRDKAFAEVAEGIQRAVGQLGSSAALHQNPRIPRPPIVDFVARKGRDGNYIVERLLMELTQAEKRTVTLSGLGGVGKTTIAAETVRKLSEQFAERIVWASAEKRADFTFSTLLDEVATQIGNPTLLKLGATEKTQAVAALLTEAPTLIVLDNFETVAEREQSLFVKFVKEETSCSSLITSRQQVAGTRNIPVDGMAPNEAEEFLSKLIGQMQDPTIFSDVIIEKIIETSEARPYVMEWVVAQIDQLAEEPKRILDKLAKGEGDAAERIFDHTFNLPQLTNDGRSALLALSLFAPSATRSALSEVAGFGRNDRRLTEAIKKLREFLLVKGIDENRRLTVEGLTRSLAASRVKGSECLLLRQRFIEYQATFAESHSQPTTENFDALEVEKHNALIAVDLAFEMAQWQDVIRIMLAMNFDGARGMLTVRGHWDEAIRFTARALTASEAANDKYTIGLFVNALGVISQQRGEYSDARKHYVRAAEIARELGAKQGLSATLHELARLAQAEENYDEAENLYNESLAIKTECGDERGIASTLGNLAAMALDRRDLERTRELCEKSLKIAKMIGDERLIAINLMHLGLEAFDEQPAEARRLLSESLEIFEKVGDQMGVARAMQNLGALASAENNTDLAVEFMKAALEIFLRLRSPEANVVREGLARMK